MQINPDSMERLVPGQLDAEGATGAETLELHLDRYRFAARYAVEGRLLDIACGAGYGTRFLVDECPGIRATGVDISPQAIDYANERYNADRLTFLSQDAMSFADTDGFDTIVTLETIEHVALPEKLIHRLHDLLKPGGVLISSVPVTPSVDVNPHHLHDFTPRSFRKLFLSLGLEEIACLSQSQWFNPLAILNKNETRARDLRPGLDLYYSRNPGSLLKRLVSTVRYGFSNRYLTCAWRNIGR